MLEVAFTRNGHRETVHPVSAVLVEGGHTRWAVGPDIASFWRSASKPWQLLCSLSELPADTVAALSDRDLALGAASHSGEPGHVAQVDSLLTRFGLDATELQCGAHLPMHEPTARALATPDNRHSNCSGKHTFLLAASAHAGWDRDYRPLNHPLQARIHARLDDWAGVHHPHGIDGCSIPTFHAPLSAQARAWAQLAVAMRDAPDSLPARIGWAMHREPWFMSGTDRLDAFVVAHATEPLAVKIGAEGLFCIARPTRGQGIAIKVHTGNTDALAVAVGAVLTELGTPLREPVPARTVRNVRQAAVGERIATWSRSC